MGNRVSKKIGYFSHSDFEKHYASYNHPECPERIQSIQKYLQDKAIWEKLSQSSFEPADEVQISLVHPSGFIKMVQEKCSGNFSHLDNDTYINQDSFSVAKLAVGACIAAGDIVAQQKVDRAFCCIRPPGHHAEKATAMGFCLFNNVAILTRYLQKEYHYERIAIIDWDVHHGNGTQHIFYDDPTVLYFSVHQYPFYPGSGGIDETGAGLGKGFTVNTPMPAGSGDEEFLNAVEQKCLPAFSEFRPDFIIISAGFDAHDNDPLAQCKMSSKGFYQLTKMIVDASTKMCEGRIVSVLEGGYNTESLSESVYLHILGLSEIDHQLEK